MASKNSLLRDYRILDAKSQTHGILLNVYGKKKFLKYPRSSGKEMLIELLNEVIVDKIHAKLDLNSLEIALGVVDGKLGLIETFYPLDWSYVEANPSIEVEGRKLFGRLLAAELLVRQTDRPSGKPAHIGVDNKDGKLVWAPIDNGHSLKGYDRGYQGVDEDLNVQFIPTLFSSTQIDSFDEIKAGIDSIRKMDFSDLVTEATEELLEIAEWTDSTRTYFEEYCKEIIGFLNKRKEKLESVLNDWWTQKQAQGGEN